MPYVEIEHVTKKFGSDVVLKDINISMEEGRVYGICGNNGSGKTVLMKCICGYPFPREWYVLRGRWLALRLIFRKVWG